MKKLLLLFITALLLVSRLIAQDVIFIKDGTELQSKVLEVLPDIVKYKVYSSLDGPTYSIYKSDILLIKYEDGRKDIFTNQEDKNHYNNLNDINDDFIVIDKRDNKKYKTVKIGKQIWMAENLNFSMDGAWCYDEKPEFCENYGKLYTWKAAQNACPEGWHLPTDEEWKELEVKLGMQNDADEEGWRGHRPGQGYRLKKGGGSEFDAEFAGYGFEKHPNYFDELGDEAYFWTSSEYIQRKKKAWYRKLTKRASVYRDKIHKQYIMSVRCVKD